MRLDIAPVDPDVASWRVDDTQTLVDIGFDGVQAARGRAAELYRALLDRDEGLTALKPGEGFATWDGSPLWLSLAGIAKPADQGVLPGIAVPGRVQVQRDRNGEWVVEHWSGLWPMRTARRHAADAVDDESLILDVLYGVPDVSSDTLTSRRLDRAQGALQFALGLASPHRGRGGEAWAMIARMCAQGSASEAMDAALTVVIAGIPASSEGPMAIAPLSRDQFASHALSGDDRRIVAGLKGLGRMVLERLRRGEVDDLDGVDTMALAVCLGRLAQTIPQESR